MIATPDLIDRLADRPKPVRRLGPPLVRVGGWLALAAVVLALLGVSHGLRADIALCLRDRIFVVGLTAALLTGGLAATAAFLLSLPDRSRLYALLPVPTLVLWLSTVGVGCLTDWIALTPGGVTLGEAASCLATLVLTSLPLSLALLLMLRHAALLRPIGVIWTGSLAVAAITASALVLFHAIDATLMVLMWQVGSSTLIIGLGGIFGRRLFARVAPRRVDPAG